MPSRRIFPARARASWTNADKWTESALASVSMGYQVGCHAAPDGVGRQLRGQRRRVRRAARGSRGLSEQSSVSRSRRRSCAERSVRGHGGHAHRHHGGRRRAGDGDQARRCRASRSREKRAPPPSSSTACTRRPSTTRRLSGSCPSRNPVVAIVVVIDSPHDPDRTTAAPSRRRSSSASPKPRCATSASGRRSTPTRRCSSHAANGAVDVFGSVGRAAPASRVVNDGPPGTMPDLQGLSARDALRRLVKLGLTRRVEGDGFVVAQDPPAGDGARDGGPMPPDARSAAWPVTRTTRGHDLGRSAGHARRTRAAEPGPVRAPASSDCGRSRASPTTPGRSRPATCSSRSRACSRRHGIRASGRRARSGRHRVRAGRAAGSSRCRGRRSPTRAWRSPFSRRSSNAIRARRCASSASPAPTARRRRRIWSRRSSRPPASAAACSGPSPTGSATRFASPRRTTPEAPDVQKLLREMVDRGCGACAMEVSSHALSLRRVDGTTFAAGVFTNLTRDHLDFHVDMETYFQAKRRLFEMLPPDAPA